MAAPHLEVFLTALKLGFTSFGGPFAHLGYFREEYVRRRQWLDDQTYADLVALCQLLPGPTSSQVGMAVGRHRAGWAGALLAWLGFTAPSALIMVAFALFWRQFPWDAGPLVRGLELAAFAVVFQATWGMARQLARGWVKAAIALGSALLLAVLPFPWTQPLVLLLAAAVGVGAFARGTDGPTSTSGPGVAAWAPWLVALAIGLVALPLVAHETGEPLVRLADSCFRAGALVFGGGHVVLPLLQAELVGTRLLSLDDFLAGYGLAQTVPGPLFTVVAFWGAIGYGPWGALVALVSIFLPSFLVLAGILPLWNGLKHRPGVRRALIAVNAAVVGFLAWTLYQPLGVEALKRPADFVVAAGLVGLLMLGKAPSWAAVLVALGAGLGLSRLGW
jgi:chromate transporter